MTRVALSCVKVKKKKMRGLVTHGQFMAVSIIDERNLQHARTEN